MIKPILKISFNQQRLMFDNKLSFQYLTGTHDNYKLLLYHDNDWVMVEGRHWQLSICIHKTETKYLCNFVHSYTGAWIISNMLKICAVDWLLCVPVCQHVWLCCYKCSIALVSLHFLQLICSCWLLQYDWSEWWFSGFVIWQSRIICS